MTLSTYEDIGFNPVDILSFPVPAWQIKELHGVTNPIIFPRLDGFISVPTDQLVFAKLLKSKRGDIGNYPEQIYDPNINLIVRNWTCIIRTQHIGIIKKFNNNVDEFLIFDPFDKKVRIASIDNDSITYQANTPYPRHTSYRLSISGPDTAYETPVPPTE